MSKRSRRSRERFNDPKMKREQDFNRRAAEKRKEREKLETAQQEDEERQAALAPGRAKRSERLKARLDRKASASARWKMINKGLATVAEPHTPNSTCDHSA